MRPDEGQPGRERAHREPHCGQLPCLELLGRLAEGGHERRVHQPEGLADLLRHNMEERSRRSLRLVGARVRSLLEDRLASRGPGGFLNSCGRL